jgi:uncharacterized protein YodC (DUF2158 family)
MFFARADSGNPEPAGRGVRAPRQAAPKFGNANNPTHERRHMIIGTDVRLKSGSALMTVAGTRRDGHIFCMWFDARGKMWRNVFPKDTLVIEVPPTKQELAAERRREKKEKRRNASAASKRWSMR